MSKAKKVAQGKSVEKPETVEQPLKSVDQHIEVIVSAWRKGVESFIETGRKLIEAKKDLAGHGQWLPMIESKLPFGPDTAEKLMAIANNPVISDSAHARNLPPHSETLYLLTKVDEKLKRPGALQAMIESGKIHPETRREDVKALWRSAPATSSGALKAKLEKANKEIAGLKDHVRELEAAHQHDLAEIQRLEADNRALRNALATAKGEPTTAGEDIPQALLRLPAPVSP